MIRFTIYGAPRTLKNHGWRTKSGKQMPSHSFAEWNKQAQMQLAVKRSGRDGLRMWTTEVNCRSLFFRDANTGDAVGYYQALADALEEGLIVANDRLIVSWDGSRLLKDAAHPRIEVELTPADCSGAS